MENQVTRAAMGFTATDMTINAGNRNDNLDRSVPRAVSFKFRDNYILTLMNYQGYYGNLQAKLTGHGVFPRELEQDNWNRNHWLIFTIDKDLTKIWDGTERVAREDMTLTEGRTIDPEEAFAKAELLLGLAG